MKKIIDLLLLFLIIGCSDSLPEKSDTEFKSLPSFNVLLIDSVTNFDTRNIPEGKRTVLFYFDPDCQHCKQETETIIAGMKNLKDVQFYFITDYPYQLLKKYYEHYQLKKYSNITVGQDVNSYFMSYYKPSGVPCMAIFQENKQLKKIIIGTTDPNILESELLN